MEEDEREQEHEHEVTDVNEWGEAQVGCASRFRTLISSMTLYDK